MRETGKIELKKDLTPDDDPGRFNLLIKQGATSIDTENNAGEGGTTGENTVNTGTYQVSETAGTTPVTDLNDYQKSIVCKAGNGTGATVATIGPDDPGPLTCRSPMAMTSSASRSTSVSRARSSSRRTSRPTTTPAASTC